MKRKTETIRTSELEELCAKVREMVFEKSFDESIRIICGSMEKYPHAPEPHNLLGIIMEKKGDHPAAMKHFRAAWSLDPTYAPAIHNMTVYGTFYSSGYCAFDESDLKTNRRNKLEIVYDVSGIHSIRREK